MIIICIRANWAITGDIIGQQTDTARKKTLIWIPLSRQTVDDRSVQRKDCRQRAPGVCAELLARWRKKQLQKRGNAWRRMPGRVAVRGYVSRPSARLTSRRPAGRVKTGYRSRVRPYVRRVTAVDDVARRSRQHVGARPRTPHENTWSRGARSDWQLDRQPTCAQWSSPYINNIGNFAAWPAATAVRGDGPSKEVLCRFTKQPRRARERESPSTEPASVVLHR